MRRAAGFLLAATLLLPAYAAAGAAHAGTDGGPLAEYAATRPGEVTAYVHDEVTGRDLILNPGALMDTASVVKASVLAELLRERHGTLTAREQTLATRMITKSDNKATNALWTDIGGAAADRALDAHLAMTHTTPDAYKFDWGLTTTTAGDQVKLLDALRSGTQLSRADADYELSLMRNVVPSERWGVSAGIPTNVTVALKNGWLPLSDGWHVNSIGVVQGDGHDYAIAVLTSGQPSFAAGKATIKGINALAWQLTAGQH